MRTYRSALLCALAALACERSAPPDAVAPAKREPPAPVTSADCRACHPAEYAAWLGSHHDRAMEVADPNTVLGEFSGATPDFTLKDGRYFVRGLPAPYTFGVAPLQQMLVELPGGKYQAYTTAWDTEKRRWFSLYPDQTFAHGDPLAWDGVYQRWNAMCADCHSTGVKKGYDLASDTYRTTWAEIDVSCQACHGPGEAHAAKPTESPLPVVLDSARREVEACAPCHSRRAQIAPAFAYGRPLLDAFLPSMLEPGLYHADGQIEGEVYEYGSFIQSKMYASGVRCSDCHEPHSAKLRVEGNALCVRCHGEQPDPRFGALRPKRYDTPEHHHHAQGSAGASCVACHMPTRTYMIVDPRQDHSIRVPRPDLSLALGTPNACTLCHAKEGAQWAADALARWYGPGRRAEPHFGAAIAAGRAGDPAAIADLERLASDAGAPSIARVTALALLAPAGPPAAPALLSAAQDAEPWVRAAAAGACDAQDEATRLAVAAPLLADPVLAVRIEAARVLAPLPAESVPESARAQLASALREFEDAQRVQADLPGAHLNLAVLRASRGDVAAAEAEYRLALRVDPDFLPAVFNLANLLNGAGRNADAEAVLREGIARAPEQGELHYSLGLLLAEQGRFDDADPMLARAAELLPARARVRYNRALLLLRLGRADEAETLLRDARRLDPADPEVARALETLAGPER